MLEDILYKVFIFGELSKLFIVLGFIPFLYCTSLIKHFECCIYFYLVCSERNSLLFVEIVLFYLSVTLKYFYSLQWLKLQKLTCEKIYFQQSCKDVANHFCHEMTILCRCFNLLTTSAKFQQNQLYIECFFRI